jgi:hypothetical protein
MLPCPAAQLRMVGGKEIESESEKSADVPTHIVLLVLGAGAGPPQFALPLMLVRRADMAYVETTKNSPTTKLRPPGRDLNSDAGTVPSVHRSAISFFVAYRFGCALDDNRVLVKIPT